MPEQDVPSSESGQQNEYPSAEDVRDSRRNSLHNLIIGLAILLLVASAMMHTYHKATTASSRASSELTSEIDTAMRATKTAYAYQDDPTGTHRLKTETRFESKSRLAAENDAIREWRKLAAPNHPVSSRRLGITLSMFGRKGGLKVLLSVDDSKTERGRRGDGETGREAPLTHSEEQETWQSLYGINSIPPSDVPRLKANIGKMNLGWFSSVALEQLYSRAGMVREARAAHLAAFQSAEMLVSTDDIEVVVLFLGILMWAAIGLRGLARRALGYLSNSPPPGFPERSARGYLGRGTDAGSVPTPKAKHVTPSTQHLTPSFSYRARTTAFAVFLGAYLFIGYPIRALLPDTRHWSDMTVLRLSTILQIVAYVPVVLLALYALRRTSALEPLQRPGLRQTLAALGMRSSRPLADIVAGVQGYVMVLPLFLVAAYISSRLFHSVHTPINPVQIRALSASGWLDRTLMLIETAIAAPIVEELMFRGILFPALKSRWGYVGGVVLTSAVFGLLHPNLPSGFLPLWTLGAAMAVVFDRRQSLLPCIVMHSLHNGFVTTVIFMVFAK